MKLIKTEEYKVKIQTPWYDKGDVVNPTYQIACELYPDLFEPLYQFVGVDKYLALNEPIWRIRTRNYVDTVISVSLTELHLSGNIELFPTRELGEQFLAQKESKRTERYSQSSIYNCLETVALFAKTDIDELTVKEIKDNLAVINNQAKHALNQLKDEQYLLHSTQK